MLRNFALDTPLTQFHDASGRREGPEARTFELDPA